MNGLEKLCKKHAKKLHPKKLKGEIDTITDLLENNRGVAVKMFELRKVDINNRPYLIAQSKELNKANGFKGMGVYNLAYNIDNSFQGIVKSNQGGNYHFLYKED